MFADSRRRLLVQFAGMSVTGLPQPSYQINFLCASRHRYVLLRVTQCPSDRRPYHLSRRAKSVCGPTLLARIVCDGAVVYYTVPWYQLLH